MLGYYPPPPHKYRRKRQRQTSLSWSSHLLLLTLLLLGSTLTSTASNDLGSSERIEETRKQDTASADTALEEECASDLPEHSKQEEEETIDSAHIPAIHAIQDANGLQGLFADAANRKDIWVVLIYDSLDACPHSAKALHNLAEVRDFYAEVMQSTPASEYTIPISVGFATLLVQPSSLPILKDLKIKETPATILFQIPEGQESVWAVDFKGSMDDAETWWQGLRHYASRLGHSTIQKRHRHLPKIKRRSATFEWPISQYHYDHQNGTIRPPSTEWVQLSFLSYWNLLVDEISELEEILIDTVPTFWSTMTNPSGKIPVDPLLSGTEAAWIRHLLEDSEEPSEDQRLWISCRCQNASPALEEAWEAQTSVLGIHHQLVFCEMEACPVPNESSPTGPHNDTILLYQFSSSRKSLDFHSSWIPALENPIRDELLAMHFEKEQEESVVEESVTINATTTTQSKFNQTVAAFLTADLASEIALELNSVMLALLIPTMLWFDRQATVPLGMAGQFSTHATLVIEYPTYSTQASRFFDSRQQATKDVIQDFQRNCRNYRQRQQEQHVIQSNTDRNSLPVSTSPLVCWVVPSTETRILTTFGIDIWSSLDEELLRRMEEHKAQNEQGEIPASNMEENDGDGVLPVLFVTNRVHEDNRGQRLQRFYLDSPQLDSEGLDEFFERLWATTTQDQGNKTGVQPLESYIQSRYPAPTSLDGNIPRPFHNSHLVSEWTAYHVMDSSRWWLGASSGSSGSSTDDSKQQNDNEEERHVLLMTYSPTCSHCKRLKVIWNTLSDLIHSLKWDQWLEIARIDVSTEEFSGVVGANMVPSVYYYFHGKQQGQETDALQQPLWYDRKEAGGISDPLEFLDWLMDITSGIESDYLDPEGLLAQLGQTHSALVDSLVQNAS